MDVFTHAMFLDWLDKIEMKYIGLVYQASGFFCTTTAFRCLRGFGFGIQSGFRSFCFNKTLCSTPALFVCFESCVSLDGLK